MKKYIYLSILPVLIMMSLPFLASAQSNIDLNRNVNLNSDPGFVGQTLNKLINVAIAIVIVISVGMLLYAGYLYISKADSEDDRKTANNIILYVSVGLVIIFLAKAIIAFVLNLVGQ